MSDDEEGKKKAVGFLYKAMMSRGPGKRQVKPVPSELIQDFAGLDDDSEEDSDFDPSTEKQDEAVGDEGDMGATGAHVDLDEEEEGEDDEEEVEDNEEDDNEEEEEMEVDDDDEQEEEDGGEAEQLVEESESEEDEDYDPDKDNIAHDPESQAGSGDDDDEDDDDEEYASDEEFDEEGEGETAGAGGVSIGDLVNLMKKTPEENSRGKEEEEGTAGEEKAGEKGKEDKKGKREVKTSGKAEDSQEAVTRKSSRPSRKSKSDAMTAITDEIAKTSKPDSKADKSSEGKTRKTKGEVKKKGKGTGTKGLKTAKTSAETPQLQHKQETGEKGAWSGGGGGAGSGLVCSVCMTGVTHSQDELVYCDGCGISVHEGCYGIPESASEASTVSSSSTEPWFCDACKAGVRPWCELCPSSFGVFKETDAGKWVHMVCALYIPGVAFRDTDKLSPVDLSELNYKHWGSKECSLCEDKRFSRSGICISCDAGMCKVSFHVTCAQREGMLSEAHPDEEIVDPFFAHCKLHGDKDQHKRRKRVWLAARLQWRKHKNVYIASEHDKSRFERKLLRNRAHYVDGKKHWPPPDFPSDKQPRLLQSSPTGLRRLLRKAELLGITTQDFVGSQDMFGRSKQYVSPAFTPDFITYYLERHQRVGETGSQLRELQLTNHKLLTQQQRAQQTVDQLEVTLKRLRDEFEEQQDKAMRIWQFINKASKKAVPVPDIVAEPLPDRATSRSLDSVSRQCDVCKSRAKQHLLIECDACNKNYHLQCLDPPLARMPKKSKTYQWLCDDCLDTTKLVSHVQVQDPSAPRALRQNAKETDRFQAGHDAKKEEEGSQKESQATSKSDPKSRKRTSRGKNTPEVPSKKIKTEGKTKKTPASKKQLSVGTKTASKVIARAKANMNAKAKQADGGVTRTIHVPMKIGGKVTYQTVLVKSSGAAAGGAGKTPSSPAVVGKQDLKVKEGVEAEGTAPKNRRQFRRMPKDLPSLLQHYKSLWPFLVPIPRKPNVFRCTKCKVNVSVDVNAVRGSLKNHIRIKHAKLVCLKYEGEDVDDLRRIRLFEPEYTQEFPFVLPAHENYNLYRCDICEETMSLSTTGGSKIRKHIRTQGHRKNAERDEGKRWKERIKMREGKRKESELKEEPEVSEDSEEKEGNEKEESRSRTKSTGGSESAEGETKKRNKERLDRRRQVEEERRENKAKRRRESRDKKREERRQAAEEAEKLAPKLTDCFVCAGSGDQDTLVMCDRCHRCFHFPCLVPPLTKTPKEIGFVWYCSFCDSDDERKKKEIPAKRPSKLREAQLERLAASADRKRKYKERKILEEERRKSVDSDGKKREVMVSGQRVVLVPGGQKGGPDGKRFSSAEQKSLAQTTDQGKDQKSVAKAKGQGKAGNSEAGKAEQTRDAKAKEQVSCKGNIGEDVIDGINLDDIGEKVITVGTGKDRISVSKVGSKIQVKADSNKRIKASVVQNAEGKRVLVLNVRQNNSGGNRATKATGPKKSAADEKRTTEREASVKTKVSGDGQQAPVQKRDENKVPIEAQATEGEQTKSVQKSDEPEKPEEVKTTKTDESNKPIEKEIEKEVPVETKTTEQEESKPVVRVGETETHAEDEEKVGERQAQVEGVEKGGEKEAQVESVEKVGQREARVEGIEKVDERETQAKRVEKVGQKEAHVEGVEKVGEKEAQVEGVEATKELVSPKGDTLGDSETKATDVTGGKGVTVPNPVAEVAVTSSSSVSLLKQNAPSELVDAHPAVADESSEQTEKPALQIMSSEDILSQTVKLLGPFIESEEDQVIDQPAEVVINPALESTVGVQPAVDTAVNSVYPGQISENYQVVNHPVEQVVSQAASASAVAPSDPSEAMLMETDSYSGVAEMGEVPDNILASPEKPPGDAETGMDVDMGSLNVVHQQLMDEIDAL